MKIYRVGGWSYVQRFLNIKPYEGCLRIQTLQKMKLVEAFKVLSSLFTSGNLYFNIYNDTVNHETVS